MILFNLIKNEMIKILKRTKTWIVFGLFFVCVVGTMFLNNYSAKEVARYNSPEGRIEQLNNQKKYLNQKIDSDKQYGDEYSNQERLSLEQELKKVEEDINIQEQRKDKADDPELWKLELQDEKEELQKQVNDSTVPDRYKTYSKERIEQIDTYLDENKKPVEQWEFNAINYAKGFIGTIGIVILVLGIATFMSDIVSGESTPATLKFLLVQPISRGKVILSKFISVTLTVLIMICGLELVAFGVVGAIKGFDGAQMQDKVGVQYEWTTPEDGGEPVISPVENSGESIERVEALVQSFGLQILFIVACCALVMLISVIFKSSMISMAVSMIISIASTMMCLMSSSLGKKVSHLIFLNYGNTTNVISGDVAKVFNNTNFSVSLGVSLMVSTIVVSYVLSHIIFTKKDILV